MGGGGAMRAAKAAGGFSFKTPTALRSNPLATSLRPIPPAASLSDPAIRVEQHQHQHQQAAQQRPASELHDWELVTQLKPLDTHDHHHHDYYDDGAHGDLLLVKDKFDADFQNRVLFGTVPTLDETTQATSQLKDALHMVSLSSIESSGSAETKACITHEYSVSQGALQAFKLLNENPAAQTVVASIASDPNVWKAMMQNESLVKFIESDKKSADCETQEPLMSPIDAESSANGVEEPKEPDGFMDLVQDVKISVVDMVNRLTSYVESWFNVPNGEKKDESSYDSPKTFLAGGTLMGLVMMVIMMVVMKRT